MEHDAGGPFGILRTKIFFPENYPTCPPTMQSNIAWPRTAILRGDWWRDLPAEHPWHSWALAGGVQCHERSVNEAAAVRSKWSWNVDCRGGSGIGRRVCWGDNMERSSNYLISFQEQVRGVGYFDNNLSVFHVWYCFALYISQGNTWWMFGHARSRIK